MKIVVQETVDGKKFIFSADVQNNMVQMGGGVVGITPLQKREKKTVALAKIRSVSESVATIENVETKLIVHYLLNF